MKKDLPSTMSPDRFQQDRLLKELTTFGIGGPAKYFMEVSHLLEMQAVLAYCQEQRLPYFILGKGSNTLFDDRGFNGLVIANRIDFLEKPEPGLWHVGAGYSFSLLGSQTARQGWSGLEFASGIPGSVGGAIYMNAGANGRETSETLISVDYISPEGKLILMDRSEITFRYRFSSFQQLKGAVVGATFRLMPSSSARTKQLDIIRYRKQTQPYDAKSAGCVFRNPDCGHAGALIEKSGLKGKTLGEAQVSTKHANFVVNTGNASARDLQALIHLVQEEVQSQTGITLETEIRCVPYDAAEVHAP